MFCRRPKTKSSTEFRQNILNTLASLSDQANSLILDRATPASNRFLLLRSRHSMPARSIHARPLHPTEWIRRWRKLIGSLLKLIRDMEIVIQTPCIMMYHDMPTEKSAIRDTGSYQTCQGRREGFSDVLPASCSGSQSSASCSGSRQSFTADKFREEAPSPPPPCSSNSSVSAQIARRRGSLAQAIKLEVGRVLQNREHTETFRDLLVQDAALPSTLIKAKFCTSGSSFWV